MIERFDKYAETGDEEFQAAYDSWDACLLPKELNAAREVNLHARGFTKVNTIWLVYVFDWNVLSYDQRKVLLTVVFNNYRIPASELDSILEISCSSSIDEVWSAAHKMENELNEFDKRFGKKSSVNNIC